MPFSAEPDGSPEWALELAAAEYPGVVRVNTRSYAVLRRRHILLRENQYVTVYEKYTSNARYEDCLQELLRLRNELITRHLNAK